MVSISSDTINTFEGAHNLNLNEGQYFLTHIFDDLLTDKKQTGYSKVSVRGNSH